MKIEYTKENKKDFREINFYQKESEKKIDEGDLKFMNFKVEKELNRRKFISLIRGAIKRAKTHGLEKISIPFEKIRDLKVDGVEEVEKALLLVENIIIAEYKFDKYLSEKKGRLKEVLIFGDFSADEKKAFKEGEVVAGGVNLARDLANEPGGNMTPSILAGEVKKLFGKNKKVKIKILDEVRAEKLGMNLFLSVGRGSAEKSKFIVLEYLNGPKSQKPTVLVGKGITFDTGGNNIKTGPHMLGMHMDMTGGATVIGAFKAVVDLGLKKNLVVLVPAAENSASGSATRPGDIIKSMSGRTVEIKNTDAEGRLVLADAISYAKKYKPEYLIDVATLTGAALVALGQRASALMSNDENLQERILDLGEKRGDYF